MKSKKELVIFLLGIVISGVVIGIWLKMGNKEEAINNFEECIAAGYPALESYPRQCITSGGKGFVEAIDDSDVACTMDAKVCPDGSVVGRIPPDCEFTLCPGK